MFDIKKTQTGEVISSIVILYLDKCKHTTSEAFANRYINTVDSVADAYTGTLNVTGGLPTAFQFSTPYLRWDDELIKVDVVSDTVVTIVSRGELGTTAASHTAGSLDIIHGGEADGSCLGMPHNCTSSDSYEKDLSIEFAFPSSQLSLDYVFYNGLESWSHSPCVVDPGETIGKRSGCSVSIKDSVDLDNYIPYPERRTTKSTLFKKLFARHPYFEGRRVRVLSGFDPFNFDESNYITREYIIDSATLKSGKLSIKGLDPLILTEDKKAKVPVASFGTLETAINDASTTFTYKDDVALAYGAVSDTVYVRIDSECIVCTVASDFVLNIVTRAYGGTEQKDHDVNATAQKCYYQSATNGIDIIEDLLNNYTSADSRFLDDYTSVKASVSTSLLTGIITKPTAVKDIINEIIKTLDLTMFYSDTQQLIKIKPVVDVGAGSINISEDDHIKKDSIDIVRNTKNQYTRNTVAWAVNNVTKTKDDENFSVVYQAVNAVIEADENKGERNEKKTFYNRWLTGSNDDVITGASIAQRVLDRNTQVPHEGTIVLDVQSVFETQGSRLEEGSIFNLYTNELSSFDGSGVADQYQVLSMKDNGNMSYTIKVRLFQDSAEADNADFVISENKEDYDLSAEFAPAAGNYKILIDSGVTIGATSTANFAFTTGTQAAGVTFDLIFKGSVLGAGADGVAAGVLTIPNPSDIEGCFLDQGSEGLQGGNALELTVPCTISAGSGALWSGGGSSASQPSSGCNTPALTYSAGNGSCGGQGYSTSSGGAAGIVYYNVSIVDQGVDGADGNITTAGILGESRGGEFGESGTDEQGLSGGAAGHAIVTNGNTYTILSGNNSINIRGSIYDV